MIKNDVAFILPSLKNDDRSAPLCQLISMLINNHRNKQFCIFNQHCDLPNTYHVPLLPVSHARYFVGDLIVLDFPSLVLAVNFPLIKNIYFITNSMPWTTSYSSYDLWKNIFVKDNLHIVATSDSVADIYRILWNNCNHQIKEINYESLLSILR